MSLVNRPPARAWHPFLIVALLLSSLPPLVTPTAVEAATITVCASGCDYTSVQQAIDSASNGDTVHIAAGVYHENLTIGKHITLQGQGQGVTVLNGGQAGRVVTMLDGAQVTMADLTITNGLLSGAPGAGVRVGQQGVLTLNNVAVTDNHTSGSGGEGGGIYLSAATLAANPGTVISSNTAYGGGGIAAIASAITLTGVVMEHNHAQGVFGPGGAIMVERGSTVVQGGSRLEHNRANFGGGAIRGKGGSITIQGASRLDNNIADRRGGGAIFLEVCCPATTLVIQEASSLSNNYARDSGGGLHMHQGTLTIRGGVRIENNVTEPGSAGLGGGGIIIDSHQTTDSNLDVSISDAVISGNQVTGSATMAGGGIAAFNFRSFTMTRTVMQNNSVTSTTTQALGAGLLIKPYAGSVSLSNNIVTGNTLAGPGVTQGGGYWLDLGENQVSVINDTLADNVAAQGAGIYCVAGCAQLVNLIVWHPNGQDLDGSVSVTYSNVHDGAPGTGNISVDPQFINPAAGTYHIQSTSPVIDQALPSVAPSVDIDLQARPAGAGVDMGADEYSTEGAVSASLVLSPSSDTTVVGDPHTVTATLTSSTGQPVAGATVTFQVSGANTASGAATTSSSGTARFAYTGTNTGTDTILAFVDGNGNGQAESGEPQATATNEYVAEPPPPPPPPPGESIRINAGGSGYTDDNGNTWSADTNTQGAASRGTTQPIANTHNDPLYQTGRYGKDFTYSVPVQAGSYLVELHFAEIYWGVAQSGGVGSRVFNVLIEGTPVLQGYDIYAEVGPLTATTKSYLADVSDGALDVRFVAVTDNAFVSALAVLVPVSQSPKLSVTPSPISFGDVLVGSTSAPVTVTMSNQGQETLEVTGIVLGGTHAADFSFTAAPPYSIPPGGTASFQGTFTPADTGTRSATLTFTSNDPASPLTVNVSGNGVTSQPPPPAVEYRVNAGGGDYTDTQGALWSADTSTQGRASRGTTEDIEGTQDDPLYQTGRYGKDFTYSFPVPNGTHQVDLHFAEIYWTAGGHLSFGQRIFDVYIEGTLVLDDYDMATDLGVLTAGVKSFSAPVLDGSLDIRFVAVVDNAFINAISVVVNNEPGASLVVQPSPINFGNVAPGATSAPLTVTMHNTGDLTLEVSDIVLGGTHAADFSFTAAPPYSIPPGGSASFQGTFTPGGVGLRTASLTFTSNDPLGPRVVEVTGRGDATAAVAFNRVTSTGGLTYPTALDIGPNSTIYVVTMQGYLRVVTVGEDKVATSVTTYTTIYNTPNVNDDGSPALDGSGNPLKGRMALGVVVDPASTPEQPILWVSHHDPRTGADPNVDATLIDTNSGIITRLVGPNFDAPGARTDYIVGLPRSREHHGTNGLRFGPDGWLYIAQGGNTNHGRPSEFFSGLPEVPLSAAILRANVNDPGFPVGLDVTPGSTVGSTQSAEVPGQFEIVATGLRNPYDVLWHSNGQMYATDNGGSTTFGDTPGEDDPGCEGTGAQAISITSPQDPDKLVRVPPGAYLGHPNPARGECIFQDGSWYRPPKAPLPTYVKWIHQYGDHMATSGMDEYRADTFGGVLQGDILAVNWSQGDTLVRVALSADGASVVDASVLADGFKDPIDVRVAPDGTIFLLEWGLPGTLTALVPAP